jgi:hypothetical protein
MLRVLMFQLIRGYEDMSSTEGSGNCADILTRDWEGITVQYIELHTPGNGMVLTVFKRASWGPVAGWPRLHVPTNHENVSRYNITIQHLTFISIFFRS